MANSIRPSVANGVKYGIPTTVAGILGTAIYLLIQNSPAPEDHHVGERVAAIEVVNATQDIRMKHVEEAVKEIKADGKATRRAVEKIARRAP